MTPKTSLLDVHPWRRFLVLADEERHWWLVHHPRVDSFQPLVKPLEQLQSTVNPWPRKGLFWPVMTPRTNNHLLGYVEVGERSQDWRGVTIRPTTPEHHWHLNSAVVRLQ